jgi:hypothetical protein
VSSGSPLLLPCSSPLASGPRVPFARTRDLDLRRRHGIKSLRELRLPCHLGLAADLSSKLEVLTASEQDGPRRNRIRFYHLLVVVSVSLFYTGMISAAYHGFSLVV